MKKNHRSFLCSIILYVYIKYYKMYRNIILISRYQLQKYINIIINYNIEYNFIQNVRIL